MGWIQYFFQWDQKPRIPHHLVTPFDWTSATEDELIIFKAGKARSRLYIGRLMVKYKTHDPFELLARLPKRKHPGIKHRLRTLVQRWEGSLPYDPIRRELHEMRREERRTAAQGVRRVKMRH
jgi:hypothetical protein